MECVTCRPVRLQLLFRFGLLALLGSLVETAKAAVVFNQMPANLELSYESFGFAANAARNFGNYVQLGGTERYLNTVTITMVTYAKQSDYQAIPLYQSAAGWNHYMEAVIYAVDNTGASPVLNYVTGRGETVLVPWKPTVVPSGYPEPAGSAYPYDGYAFNVTFQFDGMVQVPNQLVVAINFDTNHYGYQPIGVPGPYDQLNVATETITPNVGSDLSSTVFVDRKVGGQDVATLNGQSGGRSPLVSMSASATSAFEQWQAGKGLSGANGAPDADPDQDGFTNLQEFIFGLDPSNASSASPISVGPAGEGGGVASRCLVRRGYIPRAKVFTQLQNPIGSLTPHYIIREVSPQPAGLPEGYVQWEVIFDTTQTDREFLQIEVDTINL